MARTRRCFIPAYQIEASHRVIDSDCTVAEVGREIVVGGWLVAEWSVMNVGGGPTCPGRPGDLGRGIELLSGGCCRVVVGTRNRLSVLLGKLVLLCANEESVEVGR